MARTNSQPTSNASSAATPPSTHRVTKTRSSSSRSCMTRQRSRMLVETSSNAILQDMVNEAQVVAGSSASDAYSGKGKEKWADNLIETDEWEDYDSFMVDAEDEPQVRQEDVCPITDKDTKPFPIMDLPTEIRLEIYRACLTRPYNILLSKREQQVFAKPDRDGSASVFVEASSDDDVEVSAVGRSLRSRGATQQNAPSGRRPNAIAHGPSPRPVPRSARPIRMPQSRSAPGSSSSNNTNATNATQVTSNSGVVFRTATSSRPLRRIAETRNKQVIASGPERPQNQDPLIVNIMLASKDIYKEARSVLYGENLFTLDLATAMPTLACLHQRSRRQIKHVELEIPTYNEILERFQETVRLSLRYCSGLKKFVVHMPFTLPGADGSGTTGNTTVYANGFDILRWLPQECNVILTGNICTEIETVVNKHLHLAKTLDKNTYARRQLISNDTGSSN